MLKYSLFFDNNCQIFTNGVELMDEEEEKRS